MPGKLNVAFLWHMHQPYYRDPYKGKYILPWVRLHGIKGYVDMLEAVLSYCQSKVTFNLVPSLVTQLIDLTLGKETDLYFDLSKKPAEDLEVNDKRLILRHFFSANFRNMIQPYPRYRELLYRRGMRPSEEACEEAVRAFSTQDFRDIQVWFNLTWFGWASRKQYPLISDLVKKDRYFSEQEKEDLMDLQLQVLDNIIPSYKDAWQADRIDISTTPLYHPIIPLIIDNRSALISQPNDPMPEIDFRSPEDAKLQLELGREIIHDHLGKYSAGLWPSEGSVSPAACDLAREVGFQWMAADERVLMATLQGQSREEILYHSYKTSTDGPIIFFRDQYLSDAIGFRYSGNTPENAVADLLGHLENIAESLKSREGVVAIILDGENAWEYFSDGGHGFFQELYSRLNKNDTLQLTTFTDYADRNPSNSVLPPIFPASWINGSFRIWIGDPVKNTAWERLAKTADFLVKHESDKKIHEQLTRARKWLLAAEGSDWFWWYGQPNSSDFEEEFDLLFRSYLMQVYRELNAEPPEELGEPITDRKRRPEELLLFPIAPIIDGRESHFYEWAGAQLVDSGEFSGTMNIGNTICQKLYYGLSSEDFFIRVDPTFKISELEQCEVIILFTGETEAALSIRNLDQNADLLVTWQAAQAPNVEPTVAFEHIIEVKIPVINLKGLGPVIKFSIVIKINDLQAERWPREGHITCPFPTPEFLNENWLV